MLGGFIVCAIVGLLCIFMGLLIWKKKQLSLIAGYNEETFKGDKNRLAKAVGQFTILVGILTILLPFGLEFINELLGAVFCIVVVLGVIGLLIYINKLNK